ncbi:MAG: bifunctional RNase H/acid phosphatase, partial [Nocardioidaceae bacterium]
MAESYEPPAGGSAQTPKNPMLGWSGLLGPATTLIFLRHGYTIHTVEKRFSGPGGDDPGLTEEGLLLAIIASEALS